MEWALLQRMHTVQNDRCLVLEDKIRDLEMRLCIFINNVFPTLPSSLDSEGHKSVGINDP